MAWEAIPESEIPIKGRMYRVGIQIKAPYSDFLAGTIKNAIKAGVALRNMNPFDELHRTVEVRSIYHTYPLLSTRTGRSETWWIYVEFMKRTANPAIIVIYGLIALIVAAATAVLISGKSFERLVTTTADAVDKTITGSTGALTQILNPGLILAAFVIGFMVLQRRG